jgi:hypothetical protein
LAFLELRSEPGDEEQIGGDNSQIHSTHGSGIIARARDLRVSERRSSLSKLTRELVLEALHLK